MRRRGVPWRGDGRPRFDRSDWIRYASAVVGAIGGMAVWMAGIPRTGDPWQDGLIGIGFVVGALSLVLGVGVAMFGKAKDRVTLEDIKRGQDEIIAGQKEIIRLLNELIKRFDAHYGPPPDRPPPPSDSGGDGGSQGG